MTGFLKRFFDWFEEGMKYYDESNVAFDTYSGYGWYFGTFDIYERNKKN